MQEQVERCWQARTPVQVWVTGCVQLLKLTKSERLLKLWWIGETRRKLVLLLQYNVIRELPDDVQSNCCCTFAFSNRLPFADEWDTQPFQSSQLPNSLTVTLQQSSPTVMNSVQCRHLQHWRKWSSGWGRSPFGSIKEQPKMAASCAWSNHLTFLFIRVWSSVFITTCSSSHLHGKCLESFHDQQLPSDQVLILLHFLLDYGH